MTLDKRITDWFVPGIIGITLVGALELTGIPDGLLQHHLKWAEESNNKAVRIIHTGTYWGRRALYDAVLAYAIAYGVRACSNKKDP